VREETFLGMKVQIVDDEDMRNAEEGTVYVMTRVADMDPRHGSPALRARRTKTLCDSCREVCWLDPKSFDPLPAHVKRLCAQCMIAKVKEENGGKLDLG
jgi:hypothetical protein